MIQFIVANKEWIFSGIGVAVVAFVLRRVRTAVLRARKHRLRILRSRSEYLDSVYGLYEKANATDRICTCTSSWPLDPGRKRVLEQLPSNSVAFLGPIRVGLTFLGVLWRFGISQQRPADHFVFLHREVPGLKFVVVGSNVVISDSSTEKTSQHGAIWVGHKELARLLRDRFDAAAREAIPLEDRVAILIGERVKATADKSLSIREVLDHLTHGAESSAYARAFPESARLQLLKDLLQRSLPRNSLIYRMVESGEDKVLFAPSPSVQFALPAIRICNTLDCGDLRCVYCPQHGENFPLSRSILPFSVISRFIGIARGYGFTHFRLTGGEPLRQPKEILQCFEEHLGDLPSGAVSIATNGVWLAECTQALAEHPYLRLKVSLDTLDHERFRAIAGVNADTLARILQGLDLVKHSNRTGINTVVTTMNIEDVDSLIGYCEQNGFYLKLMDLNWYDDQRPSEFYDTHYVRLTPLVDRLRREFPQSRAHCTIGGFGIPMTDYILNDKTFVRVKDHTKGSTYAPFCHDSCPFWPCQEGLYQLTFTADGRLRACRHRPDLSIDVSEALQRNDGDTVRAGIDAIVDKFFRPAYCFVRETPFRTPR